MQATDTIKHVDDNDIDAAILDVVKEEGKDDAFEDTGEEEEGGIEEEYDKEETSDDRTHRVVDLMDEDDANDDEEDNHDEEYDTGKKIEILERTDMYSKLMKDKLDSFRSSRKDTKELHVTSDTRENNHDTEAPTKVVLNLKKGAKSKYLNDEVDEVDHSAHFTQVVFMTVAMALSAGFGAVPFFFVRNLSPVMNGLATATACGVMFAASFDLVHEGQPHGALMVFAGILLGTVFIQIIKNILDGVGDVRFGHLHGAKAKRLILIVGIMAAHAIGEGCGVGVSFVGEKGLAQGTLTTLAIGVHNIPEGMAKATVLISQGATASEALIWSIMTCLPQPMMAIPSYMFVNMFEFLLPIALGFAAGCMIWMVFAELLPEALKDCQASHVASAATVSAAALEGFRMMFEYLESSNHMSESVFEDKSPSWKISGENQNIPWFSAVLFTSAILSSMGVHLVTLPVPVILGSTSVMLGCLGFLPLTRDLVFSEIIPRLHIVSAALVGVLCILLLRGYILDASWIIPSPSKLASDKNGSMLQDMQAPKPLMSSKVHPKPMKMYAPLRTLAVILVITSLAHSLISGAHIARNPEKETTSLAVLYGCLFGIFSGCAISLWSIYQPSFAITGLLAASMSTACIMSMNLAAFNITFMQPYPSGSIDTLSYIIHGAISMTSFLTLAVGMSMNSRYCRFGILLTVLSIAGGCGIAYSICHMGVSSLCVSVDSLFID